MEDFELDLQFMSGLSQIAKTKEDFLDDAKKIIDGNENLTSQKKKIISTWSNPKYIIRIIKFRKRTFKKVFCGYRCWKFRRTYCFRNN